jgi:hypothetical protein
MAQDFDEDVDPKELRHVIDLLEKKFCELVERGRQRGDHRMSGLSPVSWVAKSCHMSRIAAAQRLRVGAQLDSCPDIAKALDSGEIGYQSVAAICQLKEQLGERWNETTEEQTLGFARRCSVEDLGHFCRHVRYAVDPEGFDKDSEDDYERRWLKVSPMLDGMHAVDGVLDPVTGESFRAALDALANKRGPEDVRNHGQRMADALGELLNHVMDEGRLPKRNGVRPHVSVHTTIAGLKAELGAAASELQSGIPISSKTVQRLACDGTLCRILKADSVVTDVGRATRAVSPAQRRALKATYRDCGWPDCDRPINWTNPHHIHFWARGGPNDVPNMIPLCYYHHRLAHEGECQVIRAGGEVKFVPPDRLISRWAA